MRLGVRRTPEPTIDHEIPSLRDDVPPEEFSPSQDLFPVEDIPVEEFFPVEEIPVEARPLARRLVRRLFMTACWTVLGFGFGLVLAVTLPNLFGMRDLTVLSGSMEPTIHTGDVVVEHQIPSLDARIGDVVSFKDPDDPGVLITHRIQDIQVHDGVVEFVTKGDANTGVERWKISADGTIGRVEYHVWRLGYLLYWIRGRLGRLLLVVLPALLLGAYELLRIWRPKNRRVPDDAPA
jgi:signal peptidase